MAKQKIVVAYSGGLDTSVMVHWLKTHYDAEIITCTGNLGQTKESAALHEKAYAAGASKVYHIDLRKEFLEQFTFPALKAGAVYEEAYTMATSIGRPLLAKTMVEIARKEGATMIAHGCTGKGNDQVRLKYRSERLRRTFRFLPRFACGNSNRAKRKLRMQQSTAFPFPRP